MKLTLSPLPKTWIIDLDGTILKHNGYKNEQDELLEGVQEFFAKIGSRDTVIILTSRQSKYQEQTIRFLNDHNLRYDHIIFDLPFGERILLNDDKPSGLIMGHVFNKQRDAKLEIDFEIDEEL